MSYETPLNNVTFGRFEFAKREEYKRQLTTQNAVIFRKSADLLEDVEKWLQEQFPSGGFCAGRGKGDLADALIVTPKIDAEINKNFSKDVHESKLAKKKSALGPQ